MDYLDIQHDTYDLPESNLARMPEKDQAICSNVQEMVTSRTAQLIAIQTLGKINHTKKSLYKKMLERKLNIDEALSLIKIVGRFLTNDTEILYQFPENEETHLDYALGFLELLGDSEVEIPCLEILLEIIGQTDGAEIFSDTLSKYRVYPILMEGKYVLMYTGETGEQKIYMGNGRLYEAVDYGEESNLMEIRGEVYVRDTGEKLKGVEIVSNNAGEVFLQHWDKKLGKGIIYKYYSPDKEFKVMLGYEKKAIFINGYDPITGFDTNNEKVVYH